MMKRIIRTTWDETNGKLYARLFKVYYEHGEVVMVALHQFESPLFCKSPTVANHRMTRVTKTALWFGQKAIAELAEIAEIITNDEPEIIIADKPSQWDGDTTHRMVLRKFRQGEFATHLEITEKGRVRYVGGYYFSVSDSPCGHKDEASALAAALADFRERSVTARNMVRPEEGAHAEVKTI